jgi:hypothetical protein
MTAAETVAAVRVAVDADVPLSYLEEQELGKHAHDTRSMEVDAVLVRHQLKGLADIVARQSAERLRRAQAAEAAEQARRQGDMLAERDRLWAAEADTWTRAFELAFDANPSDPMLALLSRCYMQARNPETPTPRRWRADLLHPAERARLGLE